MTFDLPGNHEAFEFEIPGTPKAKDRPRFTPRGGVYTTAETIQYEKFVKICFQQARLKKAYLIDRECPFLISIEAYFPIPTSWTKSKKAEAAAGRLPHTTRPDFDNITKTVVDALNGLAWRDDCKIYGALVIKAYSENPRVVVRIYGNEKEVEE